MMMIVNVHVYYILTAGISEFAYDEPKTIKDTEELDVST